MVCSHCHGRHWVIRAGQMYPCPECGGLGAVHCCEGLVAEPEPLAPVCATVAEPAQASWQPPASE